MSCKRVKSIKIDYTVELCGLLLAGLLLAGCGKGGTTETGGGTGAKPTPSVPSTFTPRGMAAAKLCEEYKDEAKADAAHKGKEIEVHGMVHSVRPSVLTLKGADGGNIHCAFAADQQAEVSKKKLGDEINVKGKCDGRQGNPDAFNVNLSGCKLMP